MDKVLYDYCLSFLGKPYIWGGDDPIIGYDCSGLVQEILHSVGALDTNDDLTAQGLYDYFEHKAPHMIGCQFGALVFYGESVLKITHVAFGLDAYRIIEAGGGGRSNINPSDAAANNAFVRIRPVGRRVDKVAVLKPQYVEIGMMR